MMRSLFLKIISVAAGLIVLAAVAGAQTPKQIDLWASTLFEYKFDFEHGARWQRTHAAALSYVHRVSQTRLAHDLKDVLARRGMRTTAGAGAAYLMVLHGIDPDQNLKRLIQAHRHTSDAVEDSLPDALADIAIRLHSKEAARALVAMPNGDYDAESQAMAVHKLFLAAPALEVASIADSPKLCKAFIELLPYGAWEYQQPMAPVRKLAAKFAAKSKGSNRLVFQKVAESRRWDETP